MSIKKEQFTWQFKRSKLEWPEIMITGDNLAESDYPKETDYYLIYYISAPDRFVLHNLMS